MKIAIYLDAVNQAIDNATQWHVMRQLGQALALANDVEIIDPQKIGADAAKKVLLRQKYDILLTYNKTGTDLRNNAGQALLPKLEKPQIAWLVEHPVTFFSLYKNSDSHRRHYILPNQQHKFFIKEMGLQGTASALLFGAAAQPTITPYRERSFDICIAAQWRGTPDVNAFWLHLPDRQRRFFEDVNALQSLDENGDIFTAFYAAAEHHHVPLQNISDYADHLKALYWYARKAERIKMVKDIVSSKLKILLIGGDEWKTVLPDYSNVTFAPPCAPHELLQYYQKSRAVASTNCVNGANERTFDAMACGAVSIAEDSPTLKNYFKHCNELVLYPRLQAATRVALLVDLLKDTAQGESLAARGTEAFLNAHTWNHRARDFTEQMIPLLGVQMIQSPVTPTVPAVMPADRKVGRTPRLKSTPSSTPIVFQSYVGTDQRKALAINSVPVDASYNNMPHQREYRLFKDIIRNNPPTRPWGLLSWKFNYKTYCSLESFVKFAEQAFRDGSDCVFINPMIGNEALFLNVWEQGQVVHPSLPIIERHLNWVCGIKTRHLSTHSTFAFCNYFIGTPKFWRQYTQFVDRVLESIEQAAPNDTELALAWHGSAQYKKDPSITLQPFVIERLFSTFLYNRPDLLCTSYPVDEAHYSYKFGNQLGPVLYHSHRLKERGAKMRHVLPQWDTYRSRIIQDGLLGVTFNLDDPANVLIQRDFDEAGDISKENH